MSEGLSAKRVLIVGGGLAGLSAAIGLRQRGADVVLIDRVETADGASISITNRGVDALRELGVLNDCIAAGTAGERSFFGAMMDPAGDPLPSASPPPQRTDGLPAYVAIHRGHLARILLDRARSLGVQIRTKLSFHELHDGGDEVEVAFTDGQRQCFDLVVGADGTRSSVRPLIRPDAQPVYTGWMSFRMLLENGPEGPAGFYVLPDGDMVVTSRLPGDLLYMATGLKTECRIIEQNEARHLVAGVLDRFSAPLIQGLRDRLSDDPPILVRPFEWLLVPPPWHVGRIVVVGDAAHSTTANLSSGGSMALEDGVVLAQELDRGGELPAALEAYTARRFPRTSVVVETSVKLVELIETKADPEIAAALRARAIATLIEPY